MRVLLDTPALLWWAQDAPQLSHPARTAILSETNDVFVSPISFYELGMKVRRACCIGIWAILPPPPTLTASPCWRSRSRTSTTPQ